MTEQIDVYSKAMGYLRQPYARIILPESDDTFRGEIMEFPGCIASGETAAETLTNLEEVAESWLLAALERGQNIPQPVESSNDFSGRLMLRLPKSLHKKATWVAMREGVSLNQLIVTSLSETVGERRAVTNVCISYYPPNYLQNFGKQTGQMINLAFGTNISLAPYSTVTPLLMTV
jgi:antitoxin HicB